MMGTHQPQASLFAYRVDLEQRVRPDHPLRRVAAVVDFSFVRDQVAPCYGYNGHVSIDPVVILKLMFLLFYDDVPSERELLSRLGERLDYLWFLGYGLDDPIPDHSVLSKARRRWGRAVFERLFVLQPSLQFSLTLRSRSSHNSLDVKPTLFSRSEKPTELSTSTHRVLSSAGASHLVS